MENSTTSNGIWVAIRENSKRPSLFRLRAWNKICFMEKISVKFRKAKGSIKRQKCFARLTRSFYNFTLNKPFIFEAGLDAFFSRIRSNTVDKMRGFSFLKSEI